MSRHSKENRLQSFLWWCLLCIPCISKHSLQKKERAPHASIHSLDAYNLLDLSHLSIYNLIAYMGYPPPFRSLHEAAFSNKLLFFSVDSKGLSIAVGKQEGSIVIWTASKADLEDLQQLEAALQKGKLTCLPRAHGSFAVTSVLWCGKLKSSESEDASKLLASTGLDRDFKSWQLKSKKVQPIFS